MKIQNLTPGGYAASCYLLTKGDIAVLIDPTCPAATLRTALQKSGTGLAAILLTHGHFDHMLTAAEIKAETGAPIYLGRGDRDLPADGEKNAFAVFFGFDRAYPSADRLVADGEVLTFGEITLTVRETPGHTKGSVMYLADGLAFTGDTIFAAGYGRYDLYGGDVTELFASLDALGELSPDTVIYPGHGESATLGEALTALAHLY
ncbi:MAG: MBL fold metallo-hydrolase [Clostridia bacterium]|nr:MBL fold metallo-hydrolase [Clostridia bacterium]